jgi:hypothetical protein
MTKKVKSTYNLELREYFIFFVKKRDKTNLLLHCTKDSEPAKALLNRITSKKLEKFKLVSRFSVIQVVS